MQDPFLGSTIPGQPGEKTHSQRTGADGAAVKVKAVRRTALFGRCMQFTRADEYKALGNYPYHRVIENGQGTEVQVDGKKMLMLGSNSYLELTSHPWVKARAIEAIQKYGSGCAGSRFLNGTLPIHLELERRLADLVGKEAALVFPTGFQTNTGVISCLVERGQYILSDKLNHASIVDGNQLSQAKVVRYNHSDMGDLERKLSRLPQAAGKFIVTDGVFSMEGTFASCRTSCGSRRCTART